MIGVVFVPVIPVPEGTVEKIGECLLQVFAVVFCVDYRRIFLDGFLRP